MWTSDRGRKRAVEECAADVGEVTLEEEPLGVYLEGERRWAEIYSPGGYRWRPAQGEQVLVLKSGAEREQPCIVGRYQEGELEPGEVELSSGSGKSMIRLNADGELALDGWVTVNGVGLEDLIASIAKQFAGGGV